MLLLYFCVALFYRKSFQAPQNNPEPLLKQVSSFLPLTKHFSFLNLLSGFRLLPPPPSICLPQIYSVSVTSVLGGNRPSRQTGVRGDLAVAFSCDPDASSSIVSTWLALHAWHRIVSTVHALHAWHCIVTDNLSVQYMQFMALHCQYMACTARMASHCQ